MSMLVVKCAVVLIRQSRTLIYVIAFLEVHLPPEVVAVDVSTKKSLQTPLLSLAPTTEPSAQADR